MKSKKMVALAVACHPDDIEFSMAGTLLLLKEVGCEIHMWNLSSGNCGTATLLPQDATAQRIGEARSSALLAHATFHTPLFHDLHIFSDAQCLRRVGAHIRSIRPDIILTHPLHDYLEDHQNTARLAVTAAFGRAMMNFPVDPPTPTYDKPTAIYHAMPHGLMGPLREKITAHGIVDIASVSKMKRHMLACHASQKEWLDKTQGMDSYLDSMEDNNKAVAKTFGKFEQAEAWTRHAPMGFADADFHPLKNLLGNKFYNLEGQEPI
ncbi:MAG: PIG-L deacetylase family protein [Chthoniobacterales bacterium]